MNNNLSRHRSGKTVSVVLTLFILLAAVLMASNWAVASSHREAPLISKDQFADNTDTYVFIRPDDPSKIVMVASWIPLEAPEGGPNYYEWAEDVVYDIHVDNDGDAVADFTYSLSSRVEVLNPNTFLYNTGTIDSPDDPDWNRRNFYTVVETTGSGSATLVDDQLAPPVNIGSKSTPNYEEALQDPTIYTYHDSGSGDEITIFAGQTDDAFFVDLQVFDLLTLRGNPPPIGYAEGPNRPVDSLSGFNVHSLVLEIPISRLVADDPVLGVWSTSRRPSMRVLSVGQEETSGDLVQVSRLGMPLVNEVVIPMGLKDIFNGIPPSEDLNAYSLLQESVEDPEVGNLLCLLYGVPLPGDTDDDCVTEYVPTTPRTGRGDIFDIYLTGMVLANPFTIRTADGPVTLPAGFNVNQPAGVRPAEMIRINTQISGDLCSPKPQRLGLLAGDACGFPNGRRLTDDVVDISLLAVAGAAYQALDGRDTDFTFNPDLIAVLSDNVNRNDITFQHDFPYVGVAQSGQTHFHQNGGRR
jgi:hypothetical protein